MSVFRPVGTQDTVILDTDIGSDCDDAAALALLFAGCRTQGITPAAVINDTSNPYGSGAIAAIAAYYGYEIPIGQWEQPGFFDETDPANCVYNRPLCERFPTEAATQPATEVYRRALREAADSSVVIITVGFLNAVAAALKADPALFARKVRAVVTMAGNFEAPARPEWNIIGDTAASRYFIETCPCSLFFCGFEIGNTLVTGFEAPQEHNPVSVAYQLHSGGHRFSWDPCTVDFAFTGEAGGWQLSEELAIAVNENGSLNLTSQIGGGRYFLRFANEAGREAIRQRINTILAAEPKTE